MIRRLISLIITALLLISPYCKAEENGNLLSNPGFEVLDSYGMPIDWFTDAYLKREGISQFSITETARTGNAAAEVENFDMNDARFAQTVKVSPKSMYRLSGWIQAEAIADAGRGANLSIEGIYVFSESLYETNGEWVYLETYGLTGEDQTEVTVFARVGGYSGESQGKALFDDLSLVQVDSLPAGIQAEAWYTIQTVQVIEQDNEKATAAASPFWPYLLLLCALYAAASLWIMRHLQLKRDTMPAIGSLQKEPLLPPFALLGLSAAALLRIIIALNVEGYQVDVNCFTAWGYTMSNVGPTLFYQSNWCDYTPGYLYIMWLNGLVARLLEGIVSPAFVHKLVPMTCDLVAACLTYSLAEQNRFNRRQAGLLAILVAFNPATILNSAAWCQIDSVLCVGLMFVAYFAIQRKWAIVLPMYVLCILIKPQALMLGFLGLAALIMEWQKHKPIIDDAYVPQRCRKDMLIGLGISVALALIIILPFCPNQASPLWLIDLYHDTLSSYNHATVNTANIYYLAGANWVGIDQQASVWVLIFFVLFALVCCTYTFFHQRNKYRHWYIEPTIMLAYSCCFIILAIAGCTWETLGWATMSMAFALILPLFIRSDKLENLPLCGAVIFLLLYVFGIKMHERYLFPAIFLLGMAYAIRRDRRIFALLIGTSCVLFINEGIVLDNSVRLGSTMGHLNQDTVALANLLSVLNVVFALSGIWICYDVCMNSPEVSLSDTLGEPLFPVQTYDSAPCTPLNFKPEPHLSLNRKDVLVMLAVTLVYSVVTLTTLGSNKAPQNPWKSTAPNEYVYIDLGQHYDDFSMLYFCQVSYNNFAVAVSDDMGLDEWSKDYHAQMEQGQCFQWKYLKPSYISNGQPTFVDASTFADVQKLSGRYVRINPMQVGLIVNEIIFKDADGNIIDGVNVVKRENENLTSPLLTAPENLIDEQDTLEGEPSWWNSTYFDEIYHARTAFEHLNKTNAYEWTHPPLGKIIMSWFISIFGMTPFGWRFAGALCGILMLPVMYLLVKQLTKRSEMATLAMLLMTLDCMHFTQTRLATIDSYPVLFIMLSYFFMLRFMQKDIVLEKLDKLLPELALSGFFMGCSVASKWIGVYAGLGLGVLYFWICFRHLRLGKIAECMLADGNKCASDVHQTLTLRAKGSLKRVIVLCLWCLLFFVVVPVVIYLLCYVVHFADRDFNSIGDFLKTVYQTNFGKYNSMLSYHGTPGLGMDHYYYSPWYEWPLMITPMYYASAAFKPEGMTYAIFCFGNPWVWIIGLAGITHTIYVWVRGHRYRLSDSETTLHLFRNDWDVAPAFILIGLLAQFLPWVLVPRGTYIYHYFASIPFLIMGTTLLLHYLTLHKPTFGRKVCIMYLLLCMLWFVVLFPYASGILTPNGWMDFIRDYPYISLLPDYWNNDLLVKLNTLLEKIPIFPHVYHH